MLAVVGVLAVTLLIVYFGFGINPLHLPGSWWRIVLFGTIGVLVQFALLWLYIPLVWLLPIHGKSTPDFISSGRFVVPYKDITTWRFRCLQSRASILQITFDRFPHKGIKRRLYLPAEVDVEWIRSRLSHANEQQPRRY